jgi:hypothetical protein
MEFIRMTTDYQQRLRELIRTTEANSISDKG